MIRSIADFQEEWKTTSDGTRKLYAQLTDASLAQPVSPEARTLGRIAWHLAQTLGEMPAKMGLQVDAPDEHAPVPTSAAEIRDAYDRAATSLGEAVGRMSDADLATMHDMYGDRWPAGLALRILIQHEVHHRGQMTVLMRQAGLAIPGLIGPAREEWAQWGMQPPAI
jgi:uncharacterized damage-inducible protein DinB